MYRSARDVSLITSQENTLIRSTVVKNLKTEMTLLPVVEATRNKYGEFKYDKNVSNFGLRAFQKSLLTFHDGSQYEGEWD